jgi:hypothetical protein
MTVSGNGRDHRQQAFVVEDDVPTQRLLAELIASQGLEPVSFTRLASARRALSERTPQVLIVDDDLPDGQGAELVREMMQDPRLRDIRVLFCTAAEPARRREISLLAPVLGKPFGLREVERALAKVSAP